MGKRGESRIQPKVRRDRSILGASEFNPKDIRLKKVLKDLIDTYEPTHIYYENGTVIKTEPAKGEDISDLISIGQGDIVVQVDSDYPGYKKYHIYNTSKTTGGQE
ncbi:hypothetical protein ACFLYT_01710 [Nanoarchaeota archaeon]